MHATNSNAHRLRSADIPRLAALLMVAASAVGPALAQDAPPPPAPAAAPAEAAANDSEALAKKLANPIASLISVPMKLSWDTGIGTADADRLTTIVQPVIPISLGAKWNLILRTIVPYIDAESPAPGIPGSAGLGDILQSFFFSPKAPSKRGLIWGVGPAISYPAASNDALGTGQWGLGPTVVLLRQKGGLTAGLLANHIVPVAGEEGRPEINTTFLQPFLARTWKRGTTVTLNTESVYDWHSSEWTAPVNLTVSQLVKFGKQPVSFAIGPRYYLDAPDGGPEWGGAFTATLLFPK